MNFQRIRSCGIESNSAIEMIPKEGHFSMSGVIFEVTFLKHGTFVVAPHLTTHPPYSFNSPPPSLQ